jgi:hypothetical protein
VNFDPDTATLEQLKARLRSKRSTLASLPDIPTLVAQRERLAGEINDLGQALTMALKEEDDAR